MQKNIIQIFRIFKGVISINLSIDFPDERADCYTAYMIMRQYSDLKAEKAKKGEKFRFRELSPVITVVLMEKSPRKFYWEEQKQTNTDRSESNGEQPYIHRRYSVFDTGLEGEGLSTNYFICLDIFKRKLHTDINSKKEAWLSFLASRTVEDINEVCGKFPEFLALYEEMFEFRGNLEGFMSTFSEALRIMDRNEERYMIEDLKEENTDLKEENTDLKEENTDLKEENADLKKKLKKLELELQNLKHV